MLSIDFPLWTVEGAKSSRLIIPPGLINHFFSDHSIFRNPLERPTLGIIMIETSFRIIKIISGESWEFLILQGKRYGGSYHWKAKAKQWDEETRKMTIRTEKLYYIFYATLFVKMFKINWHSGVCAGVVLFREYDWVRFGSAYYE